MRRRLLIVSTLDSKEPFGAFTRPFYLGLYLAEHFEVCQLGLDCSAVDYARSISVGDRSLSTYIKTIRESMVDFQPDVVYAQETLPAIAALIACSFPKKPASSKPAVPQNTIPKPALVFDFHTLSAFEYWSRLSTSPQPLQELKQLVKTYLAQGLLVLSGKPIIAAGKPVVQGIKKWFGVSSDRIYCLGNGIPEDILNFSGEPDPYQALRPAKIAVVVAPKTFQFPTNDMSVARSIDIAECLTAHAQEIHVVVIGREAPETHSKLPKNLSFAGFLPSRADFLAHLHYADIGLLPFPKAAVAGGARNKAMDYLACKTLVISTPEGMRGLEAFHHRQHLLVTEDSAADMAKTLLAVCQNIQAYQPLAEAAFERVQSDYSWAAIAQKVANILKQ